MATIEIIMLAARTEQGIGKRIGMRVRVQLQAFSLL